MKKMLGIMFLMSMSIVTFAFNYNAQNQQEFKKNDDEINLNIKNNKSVSFTNNHLKICNELLKFYANNDMSKVSY